MSDVGGKHKQRFPKLITSLPEADLKLNGIREWIMQGEGQQLVFFEMETSAQVPEHSHEYAQWGIAVEGLVEMTIEGKARIFEKGDEYVIPPQAKHCARFLEESRVIDFFSETGRYRPKTLR